LANNEHETVDPGYPFTYVTGDNCGYNKSQPYSEANDYFLAECDDTADLIR